MESASSWSDTVAQLSVQRQQRLVDSWAGKFYREITCRVDETLFAPPIYNFRRRVSQAMQTRDGAVTSASPPNPG